jgi:hypothetical protein
MRGMRPTRAVNASEVPDGRASLSDFEQPPDSGAQAVAFGTSGENRTVGRFRSQIITLVRMARRLLLSGWNKE